MAPCIFSPIASLFFLSFISSYFYLLPFNLFPPSFPSHIHFLLFTIFLSSYTPLIYNNVRNEELLPVTQFLDKFLLLNKRLGAP